MSYFNRWAGSQVVGGSVNVRDFAPPEIRTHYQLKDLYLPPKMVRHEQEAIPWCIAHNSQLPSGAAEHDNRCWFSWHYGIKGPDGERMGVDCEISTGGPEHKWWVDL